ncbi:MAG: cache domain-containing sensor histidine kinase [Bacillota bacterium]
MKKNKRQVPLIVFLRSITIRGKIFIFYACILMVSLSVFTILTIKISNQAIIDKATRNAGRELALINKSLFNLASYSEDYVRILSMDNRLQTQLERIKNTSLDSIGYLEVEKTLSTVISNVVQPTTHIAAASIMSTDGIFFQIGYIDNSSIATVFNRSLIEYITNEKTPVWTGLVRIKYKDGDYEDVFALAKTIIGMDTGHILGTAILYIKEKDIASVYLENILNENDKFFIVDAEKKIVSAQDKSELYTMFDEERYLGSFKLEEMPDGKSIIVNIDGIRTLVTLTDFEKLNWKIISVIPLDEITYENKEITKLIVIFGIGCLVFAFAASYLLSYSISKPILKLVNIMKEIKSGNLQLRANFNAKDEIGMLGEGFNSLMDRISSLLEQIYNEQKLKRESEFKLLQSQIKPHFLYNAIETIISFIKLNLKDNAIMAAKYLAGFYRISLSRGNDIISVEDEMHLTDNYLSIQKMRYMEYLDYVLDFDKEILKYQIPKLTLQPLVENSIYHGLKQKAGKGMLTVKGCLERNIIKIDVIDDGVGMTDEQIKSVLKNPSKDRKSTEFGIYSVNSRLKLLYGEQYGITIESRVGEYTKVTVRLPAVSYQ